MNPVRYLGAVEHFEETRTSLNQALGFAGLELRQDGMIVAVKPVTTLTEAAQRAKDLRRTLAEREVHPDVLRFCREELVADNYFHAVFEATKSVAEKIRSRTGLTKDGGVLVDDAFSFQNQPPCLALNSLRTESEQSEQKGFMNLLKGLFGTFRNTIAHAPKISWPIDRRDALDILSLVSLIHRRLDGAIEARKIVGDSTSLPVT